MFPRLFLALTGAALLVSATPSPKSVKSDVTLLFHNDLYWPNAAQHQSALLLSESLTSSAAAAACAELGETLLVPAGPYFECDFKYSLGYVAYTGQHASNERYWIASTNKGVCETLDANGDVKQEDCGSRLPALCTQSAPYIPWGNSSNSSLWDLAPPSPPAWEIEVQSEELTVLGNRDQQSFRFLGIPFANPPERFTYAELYTGPPNISATAFRSYCVQSGDFTNGSEDCLFLNVFTPYLPKSANPPKSALKPVYFWIFGGDFVTGSAATGASDGGAIASRGDVVVVTINYRVSTPGFLVLDDGVTNGNFGISDMVTALDWVQKYIKAFGGDPERVTIAGQSSGGVAVRILLGSPPAIGKYSAAILESDPTLGGYSVYTTLQEEYISASVDILNDTNCNSGDNATILTCLRAYDAQKLVNLPDVAINAVIDGNYITTPWLVLNGSAPVAHVPVMMGTLRDDAAGAISYPTSSDPIAYIQSLTGLPNATITALLDTGLWPFPNPPSGNATLDLFNVTAHFATDLGFTCGDYATMYSAALHKAFPSQWYYQGHRTYNQIDDDPNYPVCDPPKTPSHPYGDPRLPYFRCHGGDLYFTWGTLGRVQFPYRDESDLVFAQVTLDRWTSFMRTYNPNPDPEYLAVLGYKNTTDALEKTGKWEPITSIDNLTLRILEVPESQAPFGEAAQCATLGLNLSYWEML